jgi:hypothetical protein
MKDRRLSEIFEEDMLLASHLKMVRDSTIETAKAEERARIEERQSAQAARTAKKTSRSEMNERLEFAVRLLFELDTNKQLDIRHILSIPAVREFQSQQGIGEDTLRRIIRGAMPDYARRSSGRPALDEDVPEAFLRLPRRK